MSSYTSATYELTTRRRYTREEKESMVAEAAREGSVSAVARRHRVAPAQLFRWKKEFAPAAAGDEARVSEKTSGAAPAPAFVPAVLAPAPPATGRKSGPARKKPREERAVEIAFANGCVLRAPADLDEASLLRLLRALKA